MKPLKTVKPVKACKDGYGAHWHAVGWIAAVTLVISASTMTLSASAQSKTTVTPTVLLRAINDLKAHLTRVEAKIDRLGAQCVSGSTAQCPTPSTANTVNTVTETVNTPVAPANTKTTEPLNDVTKCRLACEDEFVFCTGNLQKQEQYAVCKERYNDCWTKCGQ